jgi:putative flippase GtrA
MQPLDPSRTVSQVRLASTLLSRARSLAPEATAFALTGVINALLFFVIFNATMMVGAVKATVLATVVTTTLAYVAHRYWTYRSRQKTGVRREYTLFFAFNLAGMLIQSGVVGAGKYGFGLDEETDRLMFNLCTVIGIGLATVFRFYVYRSLVFRPHPVDHARPTNTAEAIAEALEEEVEIRHLTTTLEAELEHELDGAEVEPAAPGKAA